MDSIFMDSWVNDPFFASLVAGILALLMGFIIAKIVGLLVLRLLQAAELNRILKHSGFSIRAEQRLADISETLLYSAAVIWAFYLWGIDKIAIYMILGIIGIVCIVLILSLKDSIPSLIAGFRIRNQVKEGQSISAGNAHGHVSAVRFTYILLEGRNGESIAVPNRLILSQALKH
jgi:hypothetical protein